MTKHADRDAIMVYRPRLGDRWFIGVLMPKGVSTDEMVFAYHIGRRHTGYPSRDAALQALHFITTHGPRYRWYENTLLDLEAMG